MAASHGLEYVGREDVRQEQNPTAASRSDTRDPHLPRDDDSEAVAAWRQRMGTDEAKDIYPQRAATAETVNADAKAHRGLGLASPPRPPAADS